MEKVLKSGSSLIFVVATVLLVFLLNGCGSLGKMVPLNRDLTREEIAYVHGLKSEWDIRLRVGKTDLPCNRGDFRLAWYFPLLFNAKGLGASNDAIAGVKMKLFPAILPGLADIHWTSGAIFNPEGKLNDSVNAFGISPLFDITRASNESGNTASAFFVLPFQMAGIGHTSEGWFAKIFWIISFGPGKRAMNELNHEIKASK